MGNDSRNSTPPMELSQGASVLVRLHGELQRASLLVNQNKLADARGKLVALVSQESNYFGAWFLLGVVSYRERKWMEAASAFGRAAMLNPEDFPTQLNLGRTYIEIEAFALAEQTLLGAISRSPDNASAHRALAKSYYEDKDYAAAVCSLETSLRYDPESVDALHALASANVELGNVQEARDHYEAALKKAAANKKSAHKIPAIVSQLLGLPVSMNQAALGRHVSQQTKRGKVGSAQSAETIQFAEARLLERAGDFAGAWRLLKTVNQSIWDRQPQAAKNYLTKLEKSLEYATISEKAGQQKAARRKNDGTTPLFIVGASRSGKTTFERLIGSSSNVCKGYESKIVEHAIGRTALQVGLPKFSDFWYLPQNADEVFGSVFKEALERKSHGKSVYTITYPGSIHHAGRIARAVPNARFVFMTRNSRDQALRCFQKHYRSGNTYSYNWDACLNFLKLYNELSAFWRKSLGNRAMEMSYESLIDNPAAAVTAASKLVGQTFIDTELPETGDDRDCSAPYSSFLKAY